MNAKDSKILARKFTSDEDRRPTSKQHHKPCAGCPWARHSLRGYTGSQSPMEWLSLVHGERFIDCHNTTNQQCAGAAIFRANVLKLPRDPMQLRLPSDDGKVVFKSDDEFLKHHKGWATA